MLSVRSTSAARSPGRPDYPRFADLYGEDPAWFLYSEMDSRPRIRGISDLGLVRAYLHVEAARDNPRKAVISALNQRADVLEVETEAARVATDGGESP